MNRYCYVVLLIVLGLLLTAHSGEATEQPTQPSFADRAQAGIIGATVGEVGLTTIMAFFEQIPLSSIPTWPSKLCSSSTSRQGETIVTTEHVLYRSFLMGGVVGAPVGIAISEGSRNIKISAFPEALLGSYLGFGMGVFIACKLMKLFKMLPESPLHSLLEAAVLIFIPALGAGVLGAYHYEVGILRETHQNLSLKKMP